MNRTAGFSLSTANFVWLLGSLCQAYRIPWDSAYALQRFRPPHTIESLCEAGRQHGLGFGETDTRAFAWARGTYPLIAFRQDGSAPAPVPLLVTRVEESRLLYFAPATPGPLVASIEEFASWIGPALLVATREPVKRSGQDSSVRGQRKYGFREFLREAFGFTGKW